MKAHMNIRRALFSSVATAALTAQPAFAGAKTSVQWGVDRTTTPWTLCVYDDSNVCQPELLANPSDPTPAGSAAANLNLGTGVASALTHALNGSGAITGSAGIPSLTSGYTGYFSADSFQTQMYGWGPTAGGISWQSQIWPGWGVMQTNVQDSETELQIYSNFRQGTATTVNGTNKINFASGAAFTADMALSGLPNFYLNGVEYIVTGFVAGSPNYVTVNTATGGAVTFSGGGTYIYQYGGEYGANTCQVAETAVTTSPGTGPGFFDVGTVKSFLINGTLRGSFTVNSNSSITLGSSAGTVTNATCIEYGVIDHGQNTKAQLQIENGAGEEAVGLFGHPWGSYLGVQYASPGVYLPLGIVDGENPAAYKQWWMEIEPGATIGTPGTMMLGGVRPTNTLPPSEQGEVGVLQLAPITEGGSTPTSAVNYWQASNSSTGNAVLFVTRGSDTAVNAQFDVKGAASVVFTSHTLGNNEFTIEGVGASNGWLAVGSDNTAPYIIARGGASQIGLRSLVKMTNASSWVAATNCGSLAGSTKCAVFYDPNGNPMYVPAYGAY